MTQGGNASHMPFQLTSHRLNGKNYLEWAQSVKLAIDGRGKLGHLTGETKKPGVGEIREFTRDCLVNKFYGTSHR